MLNTGVRTSVAISLRYKGISGYNSVIVALADALLLHLSVLLPVPLELGRAFCSNKKVMRLDFCRCLNVKLSHIG